VTNLENLEMSGNFAVVREISGNLPFVRGMSGRKSCQGKLLLCIHRMLADTDCDMINGKAQCNRGSLASKKC